MHVHFKLSALVSEIKSDLFTFFDFSKFSYMSILNFQISCQKLNQVITFSYPCNDSESIVLMSNFRNGDFDGFTRYENP